jgi:hypothetical protein
LRRLWALSALVMSAAPPPSVTRQQSRTLRGRGDHARTEDVLDREVVTYKGFGVQLCPLAGGYGDLGELLARGAILVHVAGGGEGVGANRVAWPVGSLVGEGLGAGDEPAAGGTLRRAVGYEGDLVEAGLYGSGRMEEVRDEGAATHVGRVGVPGPDAEEQNLLLLYGEQRLAGY